VSVTNRSLPNLEQPGARADGKAPRLSVGLAVYNGEHFLRASVDSILGQTFTDFELILSDNASTDHTEEICREYAAKDPRVRYTRNATNIGGANNENQTCRMARGEYFRWAAHDDICAPTLFEKCIQVLDSRPDVVLVYTKVVNIDDEGRENGAVFGREGTAPSAGGRFSQLSWRWHACEATYGIVRTEVIRKTPLQGNYPCSDRVLLCELAMYGPFVQLEEPLFFKRYHEGNKYKDWRGRMAWFLPELSKAGKATFPNWLELFGYVQMLRRVPVAPKDLAVCGVSLGRWGLLHGKGLAWDLVQAAYMTLRGQAFRTRRYLPENWR
jgi:glycosyltransferase involved in cell wall biosynthesis